MKALTLWRPMSAAIVHGSKRIENRPKNLPKAMQDVPTIVAVHAGKGWNEEYADLIRRIGDKVPGAGLLWTHEGIVGLMRLTGRVLTAEDVPWLNEPGDPPALNPWYSGPFGYEIDRVVAFEEPIPCKGMLGFWTMPEETLARMQICSLCGWHHPEGKPIQGCILR